jgi:hypothetical protein
MFIDADGHIGCCRGLQCVPCVCSYINAQQLQQSELQRRESLGNSPRVVQEIGSARSSLSPELEDTEGSSIVLPRRPASPHDYQLAIDFTVAKLVIAVIAKCKQFQGRTSQYKEESQELLTTLMGLNEILQIILGCPCLNRYQDVLEDILLYSTKAYAFMEKLCFKVLPISTHGVHKSAMKMSEFACRFFNHTVRLCEDYETVKKPPNQPHLVFGVCFVLGRVLYGLF